MIRLVVLLVWCAGALVAQGAVSVTGGNASEEAGGASITLQLSEITPYRVFTLDDPRRLFVDIAGIAPSQINALELDAPTAFDAVRTGPLRPGWTRMIVDLAVPLNIETAGLRRIADGATLQIDLTLVSADAFAAEAGAPPDPAWGNSALFDPEAGPDAEIGTAYVVLIDAAHGGSESGDIVAGIKEADLALIMAEELAVRLNRQSGVRAVLSRQGDVAIPEADRIATADRGNADLVITVHAEAGGGPGLRVATFGAGDPVLAGHQDNRAGAVVADGAVAGVLGDLARAETLPAAERVADALVASFARSGVPVPKVARVVAELPLLQAARFPAVAVILGGLDDPETRAFVASPQGRNLIGHTIAETVALLAR